LRHASPGGGKNGGYRTIHYYAATDVLVFLLAVYKGTIANLTKSERKALSTLLQRIAEAISGKLTSRSSKRKKEKIVSIGKELVQSAEEALAIAKGESKPGAVYVPPRVEVAAIRKKLGLSQVAFAN